MPTFTIITTSDSFNVDGTRWRRDDDGNRFVYDSNDPDADPVAEVTAEEFVGIYRH